MENLKNLTKDMIIYSSVLSEFERLDFRSDALAGVRANYFNSSNRMQSDETEIVIQNEVYKLLYKMTKNQILYWKVTKNNRPYQCVKKETGGIYCVKYYGENGNVYKKQYFDINHLWLKTEYFDKLNESKLVCTISSKIIENITVIEKATFADDTITNIELLFPSKNPPENISDALVYTNYGMIWYDKSFRPENFTDFYEVPTVANTFNITDNLFDETYQPKNKLDFSALGYLGDEDIILTPVTTIVSDEEIISDNACDELITSATVAETQPSDFVNAVNEDDITETVTEEETTITDFENSINAEDTPTIIAEQETPITEFENTINVEATSIPVTEEENIEVTDEISNDVSENTYSAYDQIEKILAEANKTNKNLFGEILEYAHPQNTAQESIDTASDAVNEALIDQILSEVSEMDKPSTEDIEITDTDTENEIKTTSNYPKHLAAEDNDFDYDDFDADDDDVNIESADDEEAYFAEMTLKKELDEFEKSEAYEIKKQQMTEFLVETQSGMYSYFGNTDENGKRTGRGRTVSPDGYTAYDGDYSNDKRDGFGVFYYKNGDINYVGDWSQNKRNGCGVGYRTSDGTMHIGKWLDNKPQEIGARFAKNGEFLDVANYADGVKHGKCITIDENGNFVVSLWKNGERISVRVLDDIFE